MGLTKSSVGAAIFKNKNIDKSNNIKVVLAGNPNVGKSTIFNALTGLNQHTGNWPGKTVSTATGYYKYKENNYSVVDIPGTYSLFAHSAEEEVARNYICFGQPAVTIVVCDATCLERNLNLVLQTIEIQKNTIVCVNLMDEAKKKNILISLNNLSQSLGVPIVGISARSKKDIEKLTQMIDEAKQAERTSSPFTLHYSDEIEAGLNKLGPIIKNITGSKINSRWLALQLLSPDASLLAECENFLGFSIIEHPEIKVCLKKIKSDFINLGLSDEKIKDMIACSVITAAEAIAKSCIKTVQKPYDIIDRKIDKVLTSKYWGFPIMLLFLALIFWITITAANYPSAVINNFLNTVLERVENLLSSAPAILRGIICDGMLKVLFWVVAVMLPPMAIFFPLFTLLEDVGFLPRIAYNLDKPLKKCKACGKQALTMCMGFGCNAAGVIGARIIDSPRERLLAIITNTFVPCNGRFPALITIITIFFLGGATGPGKGILSALLLSTVIILGILTTLFVTRLLSATLLKGFPSSFTLEMPPYRAPQIGKVIIRSVFDRTLFVLGRAILIAAPAGIFIWLMANVNYDNQSIFSLCSDFLNPFGRLIGLDGVILMAFILGFPANEIVLPLTIMAYLANGSLSEIQSISAIKEILLQNGWTITTAICFIVFSLMHWPCSTTLLTIKKETGSLKWTFLSAAVPTICGIIICFLINLISTF